MTTQFRWSGIASMIGGLVFPFALLLHPTHANGTAYTLVHVLVSAARRTQVMNNTSDATNTLTFEIFDANGKLSLHW